MKKFCHIGKGVILKSCVWLERGGGHGVTALSLCILHFLRVFVVKRNGNHSVTALL